MLQADMGMDAPEWVNGQQLLRQTEGWEETLDHLLAIMRRQGPFDGIMGFSQVGWLLGLGSGLGFSCICWDMFCKCSNAQRAVAML